MKHTLYQHGTLGTLMAGALEGTCSIDTLLQHGDHGIATLTGSDGEVIFVDGQAFHATTTDDNVHLLSGDTLTPYASVSKFSADTRHLKQLPQITKPYINKFVNACSVKTYLQ